MDTLKLAFGALRQFSVGRGAQVRSKGDPGSTCERRKVAKGCRIFHLVLVLIKEQY